MARPRQLRARPRSTRHPRGTPGALPPLWERTWVLPSQLQRGTSVLEEARAARPPPADPSWPPTERACGTSGRGHSSAVQRAGSACGGIAPPGRLCPHRSAQGDPTGAPEWEGSAKRGRPLSGVTVPLSRFHASLLAHGSLARARSGYQLGVVLSTNPQAGPCPAPGQRPAAGDGPRRTLGPQGPP